MYGPYALVGFFNFIFYYVFHTGIITARCIAFAFAGNKFITFKAIQSQGIRVSLVEWVKFIATALVSLAPNILVFKTILKLGNATDIFVFIGFICGFWLGTMSNYLLNVKLVFAHSDN